MRPRAIRRLHGASAGTTAIEFAMVAPVLLALLFGTIEYGRLIWTKQALQETATAGARCMAISQLNCAPGGTYSASSTTSFIQQVAAGWGISLPSSAITPTQNGTCAGTSGFSTVLITDTFTSPVAALINLSGGMALNATACYPNNPG